MRKRAYAAKLYVFFFFCQKILFTFTHVLIKYCIVYKVEHTHLFVKEITKITKQSYFKIFYKLFDVNAINFQQYQNIKLFRKKKIFV